MTNPVAPVPVASTDGVNIAYELELKNYGDMILVPEKIDVIDPATGKTIYTPDAEVLKKTFHKGIQPAANHSRDDEWHPESSRPADLHLVQGQPGCSAVFFGVNLTAAGG